MVRAHLQEAAIILARLANEDRLDRCLHVVVDAAPADTAIEHERLIVRVKHQLLGLAEVGAHERHPAVRELHVRRLDGQRQTLKCDRLMAPVELVRLAGRKAQRYERLCRNPCPFVPPRSREPVHAVVGAVIAATTQLFEQPLGRPPFPPGQFGFFLQNPGQNLDPLAQFWRRLNATLIPELGRPPADHLAHRRARNRQRPHNLFDRQMPLEKSASYLSDLVHADHPHKPLPANTGQQKGTLTKRQRGSRLDAKNTPQGVIIASEFTVWRVKLVAELRPGVMTETEVARIERDEQAGLADLGLRLAETKQLTAALQAQIVPAQVAVAGECRRCCSSCGHKLASKGHYPVTFRSLFGDVPVRVRRLLVCPCRGPVEVKSFGILDLGHDVVAPELAYVTARYAALVPFGKVAVLLSELLPTSGAQNAGTVRNRTRRVGEKVVRQHATEMATQTATPPGGAVVVGLDGGYVRSRRRQEERHFEVIAGKVIDADGTQHRFAFARNGQPASTEAFAQALAAAGVHADTPATVLCDGDAGLWRLQRETLPAATVVLDWWHVAIRFEHALQTARGLGAGAANADFADEAVGNLERAKWRLWHGRWTGCRRKLAGLYRWTKRKPLREVAGIDRLQRHICELLGYLERNQDMLVHYAARRRRGEPISTAFVESAVNEIVAKRMNKKQRMRWNRMTVQPFLEVRTAVLNDTLEDAFRRRYPGFRSANDDEATAAAA